MAGAETPTALRTERSMTENDSRVQKRTDAESNRQATTTLLLEGAAPDDIPVSVLLDVMDACEDADLSVHGVSILRDSSRE